MNIKTLEQVRYLLNDLAVRQAHIMYSESLRGWTVIITIALAPHCVAVGEGELTVYPSLNDAYDAVASIGIRQFYVSAPQGIAA